MHLQIKVTAVIVNSRVARSGDSKGETKHSVAIYGLSDDGLPAQFAVYGLPSAEEAKKVASLYPAGSVVRAQVAPREPYFVDVSELSVLSGK